MEDKKRYEQEKKVYVKKMIVSDLIESTFTFKEHYKKKLSEKKRNSQTRKR